MTIQDRPKPSREELIIQARILHHSIANRMKTAGITNEQVEKDVKVIFLNIQENK